MNILICGDSWSAAWGVDRTESWHNYLNSSIDNVAKSGSCNLEIVQQFERSYNNQHDLVIIGWSGATRFINNTSLGSSRIYDFSSVNHNTILFFKNKSLDDILTAWQTNIKSILSASNVPVIQFSVFGDRPLSNYENFLEVSFLEYLAIAQDMPFKYDIPIFEFDWLNKENYKLTKKFGKAYFGKHWVNACVERESVRPGKYFLPCGHPNSAGHRLWGEFVRKKIHDIFS